MDNAADAPAAGTIEILDTTLRDGAQGEGLSFSVQDKLAVVRALDELGVAWIEAGNPGSNPKDAEFFSLVRGTERDKLCAFGSTRKPFLKCDEDSQIQTLLKAETRAVSIFGKSWDLHVAEVLRVSAEENHAMIAETVAYLKSKGRLVFFDAEHFFDGWKANPAYALATLETACAAGADRVVLCDTNGGSFPAEASAAVAAAREKVPEKVPGTVMFSAGRPCDLCSEQKNCRAYAMERPNKNVLTGSDASIGRGSGSPQGWSVGGTDHNPAVPDCLGVSRDAKLHTEKIVGKQSPLLGIHAHNDTGLAIAVSLAAVEAGCAHVQGTLVGFGERCGNTCLAALIPTLQIKLGRRCIPDDRLARMSALARVVAEAANMRLPASMPYVGMSAFSHKGGMHGDGVLKVRRSFEHIDPALVGNDRHFLMSEVGGRSAIAERIKKIEPSITRDHAAVKAVAEKIKTMEAAGWAFEGADASFELLVRKELGLHKPLFSILAYRVMSEHPTGQYIDCAHAWVKVWVDGQDEVAAAEGNGPVHALDGALRRALCRFYPSLERMRLTDYKVRVIDGSSGTAAKVRVLIESSDSRRSWVTVGVSDDILDASGTALVDSIEYMLITGEAAGG